MTATKNRLKSRLGLVTIRLQITPAERDRLRILAAVSPHRTMALFARDALYTAMERAEKSAKKSGLPR